MAYLLFALAGCLMYLLALGQVGWAFYAVTLGDPMFYPFHGILGMAVLVFAQVILVLFPFVISNLFLAFRDR